MHRDWRIVFQAAIGVVCGVLAAAPAVAGIPDPSNSFYVPQAGDPDPAGALGGKDTNAPAALFEGSNAFRFFRACPNNDGGASLPNNARIKIVLRDINNNPIPNVAAADICVLFNGGTPAQLFSGVGADSVIANSQWNTAPLCPDVRCLSADGPTNAAGITFITFTGAGPNAPGVGLRNGLRKWGHYDTKLPVYALGFELPGRMTSVDPTPGTYTLRIKNFDWTGGLGAVFNQGESVTATDFNGVANGIGINNVISYWRDFDYSGAVATADFNIISQHVTHDCDTPNNP
jgi:hypothetical protein